MDESRAGRRAQQLSRSQADAAFGRETVDRTVREDEERRQREFDEIADRYDVEAMVEEGYGE